MSACTCLTFTGVALALAVVTPLIASAQAPDFPTKPVRFLVGAAAGGSGDVLARVLGDGLTPSWKQQVVVENRPGAGGVIAMQAITTNADPHMLLISAGSYLTITPFTSANLPLDIERDLQPIAMIADVPIVISAAAPTAFKTIGDLIAHATANPGKVNYAANSPGTFPHLATELFAQRAKINITYVPYKGAGAALPDALAGRLDLIAEGYSALAGAVKSGGLRPLAVSSEQRLPSLPDVPTLGESLPGFSVVGFFGVMGPAKMSPALVKRLNEDFNRVLARPDVIQRLAEVGSYVRPMSVEAYTGFLKDERARFGPLIKQMGFAPR
ncbi:MAG: tripartite tricarboxylate transporter substrate binding protein [Burkholderiales bacterium]